MVAVRWETPEMVRTRASVVAKGAAAWAGCIDVEDGGIQEVGVGQHLGNQQAMVVGAKVTGQCLTQSGDLAAQPAAGQLDQGLGIGLSGQQRI
jgi:hypothetical protein